MKMFVLILFHNLLFRLLDAGVLIVIFQNKQFLYLVIYIYLCAEKK